MCSSTTSCYDERGKGGEGKGAKMSGVKSRRDEQRRKERRRGTIWNKRNFHFYTGMVWVLTNGLKKLKGLNLPKFFWETMRPGTGF